MNESKLSFDHLHRVGARPAANRHRKPTRRGNSDLPESPMTLRYSLRWFALGCVAVVLIVAVAGFGLWCWLHPEMTRASGIVLRRSQGTKTLDGRDMSPIYHITTNLPPVLIMHGDADTLVPIEQSEWFAAKAQRANEPASQNHRATREETWLADDDLGFAVICRLVG